MLKTFFSLLFFVFTVSVPSLAYLQTLSDQTHLSTVSPHPSHQIFSLVPIKKPNGDKWRIGYFESGEFSEYPRTLSVIIQGLAQLKWLSLPTIPSGLNGHALWQFLAKNVHSETIELVADAWWQPGNFDPKLRNVVKKEIAQRLSKRHDIDLIIAMGTGAGQVMAELGAPVPTVVASTSDAVASHIVKSAEDSGLKNLHARVLPERYQRQVRLFHDIVKFKTLGFVFEDNPEGRTYGGVAAVEQVAKERHFKINACHAPKVGETIAKQAIAAVIDCYKKLAPVVDAIYVTVNPSTKPDSASLISDILRKARVPSFSMLGSEEVKYGILMSLSQANYSYVGLFYAETIARIFNGAAPRQLSQIWIDPAMIALNLQTARTIGFDPPVDILLAADEVYEAE